MIRLKPVFIALFLFAFSSALNAEELGLGNPKSKVTVIEYGSLTCDYCIGFHRKVLPLLTENYINKDKVHFVFRHYPTSKVALQAAIAAECSGDQYYLMLDLLYHNVAKWYSSKTPEVWFKEKAESLGVSGAEFQSCYSDTAVRQRIMKEQKDGFDRYGVKGTPTFIINGEVVSGKKSYQELKAIIDKYL